MSNGHSTAAVRTAAQRRHAEIYHLGASPHNKQWVADRTFPHCSSLLEFTAADPAVKSAWVAADLQPLRIESETGWVITAGAAARPAAASHQRAQNRAGNGDVPQDDVAASAVEALQAQRRKAQGAQSAYAAPCAPGQTSPNFCSQETRDMQRTFRKTEERLHKR